MAREISTRRRWGISEDRLRVVPVHSKRVEARVRGSETEHVVGYRRDGRWCDCDAHQFGRRMS